MENTIIKDSFVKDENQYVDKLSDLNKNAGVTNFDLLNVDSKKSIEDKDAEILAYTQANTITDENRDVIFEAAIELWNEYKDLVKNAICIFTLNNLEIKTVDKKLHQSVEYTTETLFYGLHLKKFFLNTLPATKGGDFTNHETNITFSNAIALYHVLSTLTVKGLNNENYAFAHLLYKLSEISKVYQHYDAASSRLNQTIGQWSMGITPAQVTDLKATIAETVKAETVTEPAVTA